jgi:dihydroflavonol-4-reductase
VKLLVTGGTGFLGTHLVERLVKAGHSVRVLVRRPQAAQALEGAEAVAGDVIDRASVRHALQGCEALYHLAGLVSFKPEDARRMYALHVDATRGVLEEAAAAGVGRVVLASTSGTIAVSRDERPRTEANDYPLTVVGRWPYYLSKIYEEKLALSFCQAKQLPLVVLNPSLLLGPGDERLSSTWLVLRFLNREIPILPSGGVSFVDVRDAADAFRAALTQGEVFGRHLLGVNQSFSELFGRLERLSGVPAPRVRLPSAATIAGSELLKRWAKLRGADVALEPQSVEMGEHFFYVDSSKAERLLGFRPRDAHETLFDTVQDLLAKLPPQSLPGTKGRLRAER